MSSESKQQQSVSRRNIALVMVTDIGKALLAAFAVVTIIAILRVTGPVALDLMNFKGEPSHAVDDVVYLVVGAIAWGCVSGVLVCIYLWTEYAAERVRERSANAS